MRVKEGGVRVRREGFFDNSPLSKHFLNNIYIYIYIFAHIYII